MANLRTGEMVTSTPGHKSEYIIDNNFTHFLHFPTFYVPIFVKLGSFLSFLTSLNSQSLNSSVTPITHAKLLMAVRWQIIHPQSPKSKIPFLMNKYKDWIFIYVNLKYCCSSCVHSNGEDTGWWWWGRVLASQRTSHHFTQCSHISLAQHISTNSETLQQTETTTKSKIISKLKLRTKEQSKSNLKTDSRAHFIYIWGILKHLVNLNFQHVTLVNYLPIKWNKVEMFNSIPLKSCDLFFIKIKNYFMWAWLESSSAMNDKDV